VTPLGHDQVRVAGFLPLRDARLLTWTGDNKGRIWDLKSLSLVKAFPNVITGAAEISPQHVLTWGGKTLTVWNQEAEVVSTFSDHEGFIRGATAVAEDRILSWDEDGKAFLWSRETGRTIAQLNHDSGKWILGMKTLKDGRIASWGMDGTLRLWLSDGQPIATLRHDDIVLGAEELRDGNVLAWGKDFTARIFCVACKMRYGRTPDLGANLFGYPTIAYDRIYMQTDDARVISLGLNELSDIRTVKLDHDFDRFYVLSPNRLMTRDRLGDYRLWDLQNGSLVAQLPKRQFGEAGYGAVHAVSSDGFVVWSRESAKAWVHSLATGERIETIAGPEDGVVEAITVEGEGILTKGGSGTLRLLDGSGSQIAEFGRVGRHKLLSGRRIFVSAGEQFAEGRIYDHSGKLLQRFVGHEFKITDVSELSPDRLVTWSADSTFRIWNAANGEQVRKVYDSSFATEGIVVGKDRIVSVTSNHRAELWDVASGKRVKTLAVAAARSGIRALGSGRFVTLDENVAWVWEAASGYVIGKLMHRSNEPVWRVEELDDGRLMTIDSRHIYIWPESEKAAVESSDRALEAANSLTVRDQCRNFLLDVEVCELVGERHFSSVDPVRSLLLQGTLWLQRGDPRAEQAFNMAIKHGDPSVPKRVATLKAAFSPKNK
jgi:WD40 repeat protein